MAFARRDRFRVSIRSAIQSKDRPVDERHFDQSLTALSNAGSRRGAFQSLAAIGAALITGIGGSAAAHQSRNDGGVQGEKKKRKVKKGPTGPAGPTGATGATGVAGPAGTPAAPLSFVTLTAADSDVLGAAAGSEVTSSAECRQASTPLNCGWFYRGAARDLDRTITDVGHESFRGVQSCRARMRRTAAVANAGGQIVATAICAS
jgi:hypothetical protein